MEMSAKHLRSVHRPVRIVYDTLPPIIVDAGYREFMDAVLNTTFPWKDETLYFSPWMPTNASHNVSVSNAPHNVSVSNAPHNVSMFHNVSMMHNVSMLHNVSTITSYNVSMHALHVYNNVSNVLLGTSLEQSDGSLE